MLVSKMVVSGQFLENLATPYNGIAIALVKIVNLQYCWDEVKLI